MTIRKIVIDALQVAPELSGVGRQVQSIGKSLAALEGQFELELRCARDARGLLAPSFPGSTRIRVPIRSSRPRFRRIAVQQLLFPLRDDSGTLVVSLGDQSALWGRARRLLVINDVRRLVRPQLDARLESAFYRLLVPVAARRAHHVVTISEFTLTEMQRVLGVDAGVVAHHPAPVVDVPPPTRADGFLLAIGALRPYKGLETIIDAVALADDGRELVVAGSGDPRAEGLEARAVRKGVRDRVHFVGWVADDELERLYHDCAATISASRYEGYGLPVAESLARGRPTIASDIAPHREIGGDAVEYFSPGDPGALASAIERVLADPEPRAEAALARSLTLARERPTWDDVILEAASAKM